MTKKVVILKFDDAKPSHHNDAVWHHQIVIFFQVLTDAPTLDGRQLEFFQGGVAKSLNPKNKEKRDLMKGLCKNKGKYFGAEMKNNWEGQFIDPSVCYKCNVMPLYSSVLNKPVYPKLCY